MSPTSTEPIAFISYAHDDDVHTEQVRDLWLALRHYGVDARLDRPAAESPQDWAIWMQREIEAADFVIVIASPAYKRRGENREDPGVGEGVAWEARQLRTLMHADPDGWHRRILRVVLPGRSVEEFPGYLGGRDITYYPVDPAGGSGLEKLVRYLLGLPYETTPALGEPPELLPRDTSPPWARPASPKSPPAGSGPAIQINVAGGTLNAIQGDGGTQSTG